VDKQVTIAPNGFSSGSAAANFLTALNGDVSPFGPLRSRGRFALNEQYEYED
jgi:hypothetical protein